MRWGLLEEYGQSLPRLNGLNKISLHIQICIKKRYDYRDCHNIFVVSDRSPKRRWKEVYVGNGVAFIIGSRYDNYHEWSTHIKW